MLINQIYEYFVKYVFGGSLWINGQSQNYSGVLLVGRNASNGAYVSESFYTIRATAYTAMDGTARYYSLGNYFSLIATIITMVAILLFCVFIVKKIIGIIFRLFTGSSAF